MQQISENPGGSITIRLRENRVAREITWEVILDVNRDGRWVRGFEVLGLGPGGFDLEKALAPYEPVSPQGAERPGTVTYDGMADAAFVYLYQLSADPDSTRLGSPYRIDQSIVEENATLGLDENGGLVTLTIPAANLPTPVSEFIELMRCDMTSAERFG